MTAFSDGDVNLNDGYVRRAPGTYLSPAARACGGTHSFLISMAPADVDDWDDDDDEFEDDENDEEEEEDEEFFPDDEDLRYAFDVHL